MIKIKNNVLNKNTFKPLQKLLMGNRFPWFYANNQVKNSGDSSFMSHTFFENHFVNSNYFETIFPLINYLKPIALINIRANLLLNRKNVNSEYHRDNIPAKTLKHKTAIFYINTNNGYTQFYDGEKIESIENRMIIFPSKLPHRAVAQTDTDQRIVINFNYFDNTL